MNRIRAYLSSLYRYFGLVSIQLYESYKTLSVTYVFWHSHNIFVVTTFDSGSQIFVGFYCNFCFEHVEIAGLSVFVLHWPCIYLKFWVVSVLLFILQDIEDISDTYLAFILTTACLDWCFHKQISCETVLNYVASYYLTVAVMSDFIHKHLFTKLLPPSCTYGLIDCSPAHFLFQ